MGHFRHNATRLVLHVEQGIFKLRLLYVWQHLALAATLSLHWVVSLAALPSNFKFHLLNALLA